ncbi:divergent polysaccharide deacetylase family protein [Phenylobacterium sp. J367]|uniref:divergent polysaccharide deacetylase family protein n=1 Tax=Phenylobacterium sp. J367 TaxID=2898435 RepID=UPI002150CBC9|nr:divergent polysaccharide deacetylase family protein [Phenylobacterium sp. J367]MCR5878399.1 divergent polysaccharide deacetylase family protein [Phenylobacterium sp. J367]
MISIPRLKPPAIDFAKLRAIDLSKLKSIDLARLKSLDAAKLKSLAASPYAGVGAAGALLLVAAAALLIMMGPAEPSGPTVKVPLAAVLRHAPEGWREALRTVKGVPITEDIIRLSDRPLDPQAIHAAQTAAHGRAGPHSGPLPPAPIAGLYAPGPGGPLPVIAPDGRTPFDAYARPFHDNGKPKVALVIGGLGLNARATQQAIETLPAPVTLSFVAYAEGLQSWIDLARQYGHEVMLETPMEPENFPDNDPGPYALMVSGSPMETAKKLEWVLSRATGYFAVTNYLGSRFLADEKAYAGFAAAVKARGLGFLDDGSAGQRTGGLPRASAGRVIDDQLTGKAIDQQLLALEAGALQRGEALGAGFAYPVTLEKVAAWAATVESRGYQLAPASALAKTK